jgi:DNA-binding LytR/AlgR family response regulator
MRELMAKYSTERKLLIFVSLVALFTILGPFGTYGELNLWERFVLWTAVITVIGALMHFCIVLAIESPRLSIAHHPVRIAFGSAVAALPGAATVVFLTGFVFSTGVSAEAVPLIWGQVFVVGTIAGIIEYPAQSSEQQTPVTTAFHARLPKDGSHDIISLTMRDHYVEVATTIGRRLVLIRFSDALKELSGLDGLRLHRSHWVARQHIVSTSLSNKNAKVTLSDGRILPVSKTYLKEVIAARPD